MHLASTPWQAASLPRERQGADTAMGRLSFVAATKAPCDPVSLTQS